MNQKNKAFFNWSGGKDSSLCLLHILSNPKWDIRFLFTTLNGSNKRVSMHGVSDTLLEKQSKSINIPLKKLYLPEQTSMEEYNLKMSNILSEAKADGINYSIFGDIFLEDLRNYREQQLARAGLKAIFPLWGLDTHSVAKDFINKDFKAIVVSVDNRYLDKSFAGRIYDEQFLIDLPQNVDPCGENGEFHTFVFDGPIFKKPIALEKGDIVYKAYQSPDKSHPEKNIGFWFCDLN
ncbi:MAG: diphthine--ammonia ligase [Bacteroidota bacterium]|nr:diphthine--ammonia ligase [Bacteroidota bacterium]